MLATMSAATRFAAISKHLGFASLAALGAACSSDPATDTTGQPPASTPLTCELPAAPIETGDPNGHPDPFGAKAAKQARAGRLTDASAIVQPAHGRQRIRPGDFVLVNEAIAVAIEDAKTSDGYARFGGEILAIDRVGDDGRPAGVSYYNETLIGLAIEMIRPSSVTVVRDGSDGGEAVVRALGQFAPIPFLEGPLKALFPQPRGLEGAIDFVLAPGWEKLLLRLHIVNRGTAPIDFGVDRPGSDEMFGFFHYSRSRRVTGPFGYGKPSGFLDWVGFEAGPFGFAFRKPGGQLEFAVEQSGFELFWGPGFVAPACAVSTTDHVEVIAGGPEYDGLLAAVRRATGEPAWRAIEGTVTDASGKPVEGAIVVEIGDGGALLSRTTAGAGGKFTIHAPNQAVTLVAYRRGYPPHDGVTVAADAKSAELKLAPHAMIHVTATKGESDEPLPVRVQVVPKEPLAGTPEEWGVIDEADGRLHQEFAVTGEATLVVPPGTHRVVVSRGYEWELLDTEVTVAAGETAEIAAPLVRSVDTTGRMCADFHIHSFYSADSNDPVDHKVKGAIADGLDIPVSSEHEWVIDFQPIIEELGLTKWAFGMASQELTTFTWGHFGVVPLDPDDDAHNHGAVDWIGKKPNDVFGWIRTLPIDPAIVVNHPSGGGFQAYFSQARFRRETGKGDDPELWSDDFDAVEVFNDSDLEDNRDGSLADWFALLNHGRTVWATGSSDSHHIRTSPVGYPRTCMWFGHDDPTKLTPEVVRDALLSGDSTIGGGLYMTVLGPGEEHPGQTVKTGGAEATFVVTVEAPSWLAADTLETIVDGETVAVEPLLPLGAGPSKRYVNEVKVSKKAGAKRSWVIFHAKGEGDLAPLHPGRKPFAVSNPVFLE